MSRRIFSAVLGLALSAVGGWAQGYQTGFERVTFDRDHGRTSLHGEVDVEGATGAANVQIPLGPGIGERGLRFVPSFRLHSSALSWTVTSASDPNYGVGTPPFLLNPAFMGMNFTALLYIQSQTQTDSYSSGGSGGFSPGTLDFVTSDLHNANNATIIAFPDGSSSTLGGALPSGVDALQAAKAFGHGSDQGWSLGSVPYWTSSTTSQTPQPLTQLGGHGELVIGLVKSGIAPVVQIVDPAMSTRTWQIPSCILVIRGDVAYEFALSGTVNGGIFVTLPRVASQPSGKNKPWLSKASYVLARMINRYGESIVFDQGVSTLGMTTNGVVPNGLDFTARWYRNGQDTGVSVSVKYMSQVTFATAQPGIGGNMVSSGRYVQISYAGVANAPTVTMKLSGPDGSSSYAPTSQAAQWQTGNFDQPWDAPRSSVLPVEITNTASQETLTFGYGSVFGWPVLNKVTYPSGRSVTLNWGSYSYRPNGAPTSWSGYHSDPLRQNAQATGVTRVDDWDPSSGVTRTTTHSRQVPQPDWTSSTAWTSTTFYDAVTYPDGRAKVFYYVEPTQDGAASYQTLAHLNHQVREIREYPDGQWSGDVGTATAQSTSPIITVMDRWDTRRLGNPSGDPAVFGSDVYPTRTRHWDKETGLLKVQEKSAWDGFASWGTNTSQTFRSTTATPDLTVNFQSLALGAQPITYANEQQRAVGQSAFTFDATNWIGPLATQESQTVPLDATAVQSTVPFTAPPVARTFVPGYSLVRASTAGASGGPQVTTQFSYQGDASLTPSDMAKLSGVTLSDPNNAQTPLSGQVGIAAYGYDSLGYMNSIQPKGAAWTVNETRDAFGRVLTQTGADKVVTTYQWDSAGRLASVQQGSELATTYQYDDAGHRSVTVTRGTQVSTLIFDGFGQMVMEKRQNDQGVWSYRLTGHDLGGRVTGVTVWSDHGTDSDAAKGNLVTQTSTFTPGYTVCTKQDLDGNCLSWKTVPDKTTVNAPLYAGTATSYDPRGRVVKVVDPNGVEVDTAYGTWSGGPQVTRTVKSASVFNGTGTTVKDLVTTLQYDPVGRLCALIDAKGQTTSYSYDAAGRILSVRQADPATGAAQTRTWAYDTLGRLTTLVQPESGTTVYSAFTVTGKPTVTTYQGDGSTPTRSTTATFDPMGRMIGLISPDGLNQSWTYDDGPADGTSSRGKLVSASANGATRSLSYDTAGRLSLLRRTVDGLTFDQSYGYDPNYGFLTSRTYPDGKVQTLAYGNAAGLPSGTGFNGANLASMAYDPIYWGLKGITFANGGSSYFDYGADQVRLKSMNHLQSATTLKSWTYSYDAVGQLQTDGEDYYYYDELGRLIQAGVRDPFGATNAGQMQQLGYDAFGNRTSLASTAISWTSAPGATTATWTSQGVSTKPGLATYAMNSTEKATLGATNRLPGAVGGIATGVSYDGQGNLTAVYRTPGQSATQLLLGYDALGRVTTLSDTANATSQIYLHDDEGLRLKIVDSKTNKTTYNVYNEARQLVATYEKVGTGALTWKKDVLYVGTKEVAEIDATKTWVTFVDHLGSPRFIWDGTANPVKGTNLIEQKFMPFGESLADPTGAAKFAKGFTNHEQTDASGLIYMQARMYLPWMGRFASPDPARDQHFEMTQSWNIYSYVQNNPTMLIDPNGMAAQDPAQAGWAAAKIGQIPPDGPVQTTSGSRTAAFVMDHPFLARAIGSVSPGSNNISTTAVRFTTQLGLEERASREGSEVNAARHALWSATITSWFGSGVAQRIGDAHEDTPDLLKGQNPNSASFKSSSEADSAVDQLNNQIGRSIGEANQGASMKELAGKVIGEFSKNGLWTTVKQKDGTYKLQRTQLDSKKAAAAQKTVQNLDSNGRKKPEDKK